MQFKVLRDIIKILIEKVENLKNHMLEIKQLV